MLKFDSFLEIKKPYKTTQLFSNKTTYKTDPETTLRQLIRKRNPYKYARDN